MEALELLDIDLEDDNLLCTSSPENKDAESVLGVSPPSPSLISGKKKGLPSGEKNSLGAVEETESKVATFPDSEEKIAPPTSNSVLSVLDVNAINYSSLSHGVGEGSAPRKNQYSKDSVQIDGGGEMSATRNPTGLSSHPGSSYLDTSRQQRQETTVEANAAVPTRIRTRRATTLRKSLAWDKAFFTDEGVLDPEELLVVSSDIGKELRMPELPSLRDGPRGLLIMPLPIVPRHGSRAPDFLPPEVLAHSSCLNPHSDMVPISISSSDNGQGTISHASLNPLSRAVEQAPGTNAVEQAPITTLNPVLTTSSRPVKQAEVSNSSTLPISSKGADKAQGINCNIKVPGAAMTGLNQARPGASKNVLDSPVQHGSRLRLPSSFSKKAEERTVEEPQKWKQTGLVRTMSTPTLHGSPSTSSSLSRKVSSMSKKVKDTLGKVITGRGQKTGTPPLSQHVPSSVKGAIAPKKLGGLPTVPEVKESSTRVTTSAPAGAEKDTKGTFTVRDILRGKGMSSPTLEPKSKDMSRPGRILTRSKSAMAVPGLPRSLPDSTGDSMASPAEPLFAAKPSGLRKPSPKLGFFDSARALATPSPCAVSRQVSPEARQVFQSARHVSGATTSKLPIAGTNGSAGALLQRLQAPPSSRGNSAIPSAPHLRWGAASAPTSPRARSFPSNETQAQRPNPPMQIGRPYSSPNVSGVPYVKTVAETHCIAERKVQFGARYCKIEDGDVLRNVSSIEATASVSPDPGVVAVCDSKLHVHSMQGGPLSESKGIISSVQESTLSTDADYSPVGCGSTPYSEAEAAGSDNVKASESLSLVEKNSASLRVVVSGCEVDIDSVGDSTLSENADNSSSQSSRVLTEASLTPGGTSESAQSPGCEELRQTGSPESIVVSAASGTLASLSPTLDSVCLRNSVFEPSEHLNSAHISDASEVSTLATKSPTAAGESLSSPGSMTVIGPSPRIAFLCPAASGCDQSSDNDKSMHSTSPGSTVVNEASLDFGLSFLVPASEFPPNSRHQLAEHLSYPSSRIAADPSQRLATAPPSAASEFSSSPDGRSASEASPRFTIQFPGATNKLFGSPRSRDFSEASHKFSPVAALDCAQNSEDLNFSRSRNGSEALPRLATPSLTTACGVLSSPGSITVSEASQPLAVTCHVADNEIPSSSRSRTTSLMSPRYASLSSGAPDYAQNSGSVQSGYSSSPSSRADSEASPGAAVDHAQNSNSEQSEHLDSPRSRDGSEAFPRLATPSAAATDVLSSQDSIGVNEASPRLASTRVAADATPCTPGSRNVSPTLSRFATSSPGAGPDYAQSSASGKADSSPGLGTLIPTAANEHFQNFACNQSSQSNSPSSQGFGEALSRPGTPISAAASKSARRSGTMQPWLSSSPSSRVADERSPRHYLTPVSGKRSSVLRFNQRADAMGTSEAGLKTPLSAQQVCASTYSTGAVGPRTCTPEGSAQKGEGHVMVESPASHWSDWPVLGAAIAAQMRKSKDKMEGLKSVSPRTPEEHKSGSLMANGGSVSKTTSPNAPPAVADSGGSRNPLAGLNVAEGHGSHKKERGSLFAFARKAVSRLTMSPVSAEASGQENEGSPGSRKNRRSKLPGNTSSADSKPPSPFSEERICALEAAGQECLEMKNGPVKNSPPEKSVPKRNPWSPVRKNRQQLGPFDCTKLNQYARSVQGDSLCMPMQVEMVQQVGIQSSWTAYSRLRRSRARILNKAPTRIGGPVFELFSPFLLLFVTLFMYL